MLLLCSAAYARSGQVKLLAVIEGGDDLEGSIADLTLELRPGEGRVFLDTYPISKFDTQVSTRFAKEVACKELDADCDKYDFVYTIRSNSGIIGGPSAGAAVSMLTMAVLEDFKGDEAVTLTGTINSGGLIGPVGGLKEKIAVAASEGLRKVLISSGTRFINETNETLDLYEYGKEKGIEVKEVDNVLDALYEFTGKDLRKPDKEIVIDNNYAAIMEELADQMCEGTQEMQKRLLERQADVTDEFIEIEERALNLTLHAEDARQEGNSYAAASYCFGANINYRLLTFMAQNISTLEKLEVFAALDVAIESAKRGLESRDVQTLTDLQTYMLVKERVLESEELLEEAKEKVNTTDLYSLAFAMERLKSAASWSTFFDTGDQEYVMDRGTLENSCILKIGEAEQRMNYASLYLPIGMQEVSKAIDQAREEQEAGDYRMCLYRASFAKARANVVLSSIGVERSQVQNLITRKLGAARNVIATEIEKGRFPIIGYSYYNYASSLQETDRGSSLLYAEYALELGNFDLYFKQKKKFTIPAFPVDIFITLAVGIILGGLIVSVFYKRKKKASLRYMKKRHRR